jgi:cytoskeleton-associated protein 5
MSFPPHGVGVVSHPKLSEAYVLIGEKIWSLVGSLTPKDKTQLEERLRRVAGPSSPDTENIPLPVSQVSRLSADTGRPGSPSVKPRIGGIPRPGGSSIPPSRLARAASPGPGRALSPVSGSSISRVPSGSGPSVPSSPVRSKLQAPSRLAAPKSRSETPKSIEEVPRTLSHRGMPSISESTDFFGAAPDPAESAAGDISIVISSILSNDPTRSVDALKKIQKILEVTPESGPSSPAYRDLAEHTEGLVETITLQMGHVFERPSDVIVPENFRLAKHLIQTLNAFCDHVLLAESLTVDSLTSLLEELTLRLLETDDSNDTKVKDLSRFINMIILRLFATCRRMSIFRRVSC